MIPSPKVKKHLSEIKREQWTAEELRELLKAIAQYFQIHIKIAEDPLYCVFVIILANACCHRKHFLV